MINEYLVRFSYGDAVGANFMYIYIITSYNYVNITHLKQEGGYSKLVICQKFRTEVS